MNGKQAKINRRKSRQLARQNAIEFLNGLENIDLKTRFKVCFKILFNRYKKDKKPPG